MNNMTLSGSRIIGIGEVAGTPVPSASAFPGGVIPTDFYEYAVSGKYLYENDQIVTASNWVAPEMFPTGSDPLTGLPYPVYTDEEKLQILQERVVNKRAIEYDNAGCSVKELVVALWEAQLENKTGSLDIIQAKRLEIKDKNPKPTSL